MIPVKIIRKAKGTSSSQSSQADGGGSSSYSQESNHSVYSDLANKAKIAENAAHANSAAEIDSNSSIWNVIRGWISGLDDVYLSKVANDIAHGRITFEQGLESLSGATIDGDMDVTGAASVDGPLSVIGNATVGGDLDVKGNATLTDVVVDRVHDAKSTPAERVIVGAQGFDLYMGEDGESHLYIDYLTART